MGHTGTLDPFATGLLILVFGRATRLARFAEALPKTYRAEVRLGIRTATDDPTGEVLGELTPPAWPGKGEVGEALTRLIGPQRQRPPSFSAKRIGGERSHRLARRGAAVTLQPVDVTVHAIELLAYHPPVVSLRCEVSAGTYIRALGRDLGEMLGTGAHVAVLRRERIGPHRAEAAWPLGSLTGTEPVLPALELLTHLPAVVLEPDEARAVSLGRDVARPEVGAGEAALVTEGRLLAVATAVPGGWHPVVVLA